MKHISGKVKIIRLFRRIIFFYLSAFMLHVHAQTYYFDNYSVFDGLAHSKVYAILQDHEGYVWIGTQNGVSRFDGNSFRNYATEDNIAEGGVRAIFEDSNKNIWFGHNEGGVSCYKNGRMKIYENSKLLFNSDITSITEDDKGRLWITSSASGAVLLDNPNDDFANIKYEQYKGKRLSDRVFNSTKMKDGTIFFITDVGIKKFNTDSNNFENLVIEGLPLYFNFITIFEDSKENLWFGTFHGGLYKYIKEKHTLVIYDAVRDGIANNWISYITEDRNGRVWVGTWGGGISVFDGDKLKNYTIENGLGDNFIWCIEDDYEGNMLIGTKEHGLYIFKGEQFASLTEKDGLNNPQVWAIQQDKRGRYWFGTNNGITLYDPKESKYNEFMYFTHASGFSGEKVRFIKEDKNGDIWIGTEGMGVFQYQFDSRDFYFNALLNSYLPQNDRSAYAMEIDDNNNLWIGTNDGVTYYEIGKKVIPARLTQGNGLAGNEITALFFDSKKILWIGSKGKGVTIYNDKDTLFTIIEALGKITPKTINEDKMGNIWIGTDGKGVFVFDREKIVKQYRERDGILSNNIAFINVDKNNNIYIGTSKGLNKVDQEANKIYTYTQRNGFVGIEAKDNASYRDRNGEMWFGTAKGVVKFNPYLKKDPAPEPLTHISKFQVNNTNREMVPGLKLRHVEKFIRLDFISICLTNPEVVSYQYMLEGVDSEWQPATKTPTIPYPALPPDKYTFKVKAKNCEGEWNTTPVSFTFTIKPAFYQTTWFITLAIIFGLVGVILFIKRREQNLIREKKILEDKVTERTKEVVQKSEELAIKNRDITDSIRYAKRIQDAILPPELPFPETFILFKPKDIVSGDFYWLETTEDKEMIAAVDCTGHGVPGAFMSIIGHNMLTKIVKEYGITQPAAILDQLNVEISNTLHQKGQDIVNDGMDMSLLSFDKKRFVLEYAGAFNPAYLIRNKELIEIKANRFAIGRSSTLEKKKFDNMETPLQKGDAVYIFSDGYADQFGGPDGKKFKTKQLKDILLTIQNLSMEEQKEFLNKAIESWKGSVEQIDDIVFIGRRF